jgi:hypothetical protein
MTRFRMCVLVLLLALLVPSILVSCAAPPGGHPDRYGRGADVPE